MEMSTVSSGGIYVLFVYSADPQSLSWHHLTTRRIKPRANQPSSVIVVVVRGGGEGEEKK